MHCHTVHLPLGALLTWCTMCGTGAGILGSELGALLTSYLGVSTSAEGSTDFTHLFDLVLICNLSSLLPLLGLGLLDAAPASADDDGDAGGDAGGGGGGGGGGQLAPAGDVSSSAS